MRSAGEALLVASGVQEGSCPGVGGFDGAWRVHGIRRAAREPLAGRGDLLQTIAPVFSGRPPDPTCVGVERVSFVNESHLWVVYLCVEVVFGGVGAQIYVELVCICCKWIPYNAMFCWNFFRCVAHLGATSRQQGCRARCKHPGEISFRGDRDEEQRDVVPVCRGRGESFDGRGV